MLKLVETSQASAKQRAGRAGREAPGEAYRLYVESEFARFPAQTPAEILRCELASVYLQLKSLGIQKVLSFPLVDRPPQESLVKAAHFLCRIGALDKNDEMTEVGRGLGSAPCSGAKAHGRRRLAWIRRPWQSPQLRHHRTSPRTPRLALHPHRNGPRQAPRPTNHMSTSPPTRPPWGCRSTAGPETHGAAGARGIAEASRFPQPTGFSGAERMAPSLSTRSLEPIAQREPIKRRRGQRDRRSPWRLRSP